MALALFLASALAFATPANNPGAWLSDRDYPAGALKRREEGTVGFRLLISPTGQVGRCDVTQSSNSADLDAATCAMIVGRSRFKPARDETGQPSYNLYSGHLSWTLPGRAPPRTRPPIPSPDMELTVRQLPDGSREKTIRLIARFDATGQMVACEPSSSNLKEGRLARVGCAQAQALPVEIIKDNEGNAISFIRGINLLFKAEE